MSIIFRIFAVTYGRTEAIYLAIYQRNGNIYNAQGQIVKQLDKLHIVNCK